jgi:N-acetylneuraminic acid mutarotase
MIGNDLILFSGFSRVWSKVTNKTFALNTRKLSDGWREMDPIPVPLGLTHTGYVFHNNSIYACGGFIGGFPYATSDICYMYTHTNPIGTQWTTFTSIPGVRAGGGMIYDKERNSLLFYAGASRHNKFDLQTKVDHDDVWELSLSNLNGSWTPKASIPYSANHVGSTTVQYEGQQHHFVLGGQIGSNEPNDNVNLVYQYNSTDDTWIQRQSMPFARGHFSGSVEPYKSCGFLISGGAINGGRITNDISYYSILHNNWTKLGTLPIPRNTPICVIKGGYYYCQSGYVRGSFSYRRRIV